MAGWLDNTRTIPDEMIRRGTFYPPVGSRKFFELYRPPSELPPETVLAHLRQAVIAVGRQLDDWRANQTAATLADVPCETVDNVSELVILWERAVYCEAKAEILRETLTADRRATAENAAKTGSETEEKYREFAADAIAQIRGEARIYVGDI